MDAKLLDEAQKAKSAKELRDMAKTRGIELTEAEAENYYCRLHRLGELSDDELSDVAGGGCHQKDGRLVVTVGTQKDCFVCKTCGKTAEDNFIPAGIMAITGNSHRCKGTNSISNCGNCKFISHENGLWLCNNPANIK